MKTVIRVFIVLFILFILLYLKARDDADVSGVFRVSDGKKITFNEMIREIRGSNLVFVGEVHTDKLHHELELDVIRSLNNAKVPVAVGFEMFRADSQNELDKWVKGALPLDAFIRVYYDNWEMPWPLYRDILMYLREESIPAIGLNLPDELSEKVDKNGFSSLSKEELEKLPPGISCSVDQKYMEFIQKAYRAHGRTGGQFVNFCEAQMMWNKTMAWHLVGYLKKNPDRTVVVITGTGHAWKRGAPEQVALLSGETHYKVILPEIPGYIDPKDMTSADADYIVLTQ